MAADATGIRTYNGGAVQSALVAGIVAGTLTFSISPTTKWPTANFTLVIDEGLSSEESILCDALSGGVITVNALGRGYDNTTAVSHAIGAIVRHVPTATDLAEANYIANFHSAPAKTTPVDADVIPLNDSAAANILKSLSWANIKATLKTYFDTLYTAKSLLSAKGSLISASAANTPVELLIGADATVLTADSTQASGVKWAAPVAGAVSLASGSLSGTSTLLSGISGSYRDLILDIDAFYLSATGWGLYLRLNDDATANRHYGSAAFASVTTQAAFNDTKVLISTDNYGNTSSGRGKIRILIPGYASSTSWKQLMAYGLGEGNEVPSTSFTYLVNAGFYNQLTAISSLRILNGAAATQAGTYTLWGVN